MERSCVSPRLSAPPGGPVRIAAPTLATVLHLRNGLTVSVRPVTGDDEAALMAFLAGLSVDSRRLRFFTTGVDLRAEAHRGAAGDDSEHHGVVALAPGGRLVGHAIYVRCAGAQRAEVAVEVADDFHHLGLATLLIIRLAQCAEGRDIKSFYAEVLPENLDMLAVFREGFAAMTVNRRDEVDVEFATSSWRAAQARFES
jgi:GNAT superfamily N-acetyltransferase